MGPGWGGTAGDSRRDSKKPATTLTETRPARAHSTNTCVNVAASAPSWRTLNRTIVAWSGIRFAQMTRKDILPAAPLDLPRRALPDRIGVQQQRDHHLRIKRRPTPAVVPVLGVERTQVDRVYRIEHKPGQMILSQPLTAARHPRPSHTTRRSSTLSNAKRSAQPGKHAGSVADARQVEPGRARASIPESRAEATAHRRTPMSPPGLARIMAPTPRSTSAVFFLEHPRSAS